MRLLIRATLLNGRGFLIGRPSWWNRKLDRLCHQAACPGGIAKLMDFGGVKTSIEDRRSP
jgi:hypothetical protein